MATQQVIQHVNDDRLSCMTYSLRSNTRLCELQSPCSIMYISYVGQGVRAGVIFLHSPAERKYSDMTGTCVLGDCKPITELYTAHIWCICTHGVNISFTLDNLDDVVLPSIFILPLSLRLRKIAYKIQRFCWDSDSWSCLTRFIRYKS